MLKYCALLESSSYWIELDMNHFYNEIQRRVSRREKKRKKDTEAKSRNEDILHTHSVLSLDMQIDLISDLQLVRLHRKLT